MEKKEKVLLISRTMIPSVLLCGHSQLSLLKEDNYIDYRFVEALKIKEDDLNWADVVVFVRSESLVEVGCSELLKKAGKKQIYVIDDDLLAVPDGLSSSEYYQRLDVHMQMEQMLENADLILCPSPKLAKAYTQYNDNVRTFDEPELNFKITREKNDVLRIGFAGSYDRQEDIDTILTSVIRRLKKECKTKLEFEFIGPVPEEIKNEVKSFSYQDSYEDYQKLLKERNWDIALAPLLETEFNSFKYWNKFVEYTAAAIPGIYSNVTPYKEVIENGDLGLLADNNEDSWVAAIKMMIRTKRTREKILKNAQAYMISNNNLDLLAFDWYQIVLKYSTENARAIPAGALLKYRWKQFTNRIKYEASKRGWSLPKWTILKLSDKLLNTHYTL